MNVQRVNNNSLIQTQDEQKVSEIQKNADEAKGVEGEGKVASGRKQASSNEQGAGVGSEKLKDI